MKATLHALSNGAGTPVLTVDFLQFTAARSLGSVLAGCCGDRLVLRADPVGDLTKTDDLPDILALADAYAVAYAKTPAAAGRPALVVGYCSAAILALRLAERLSHRGLQAGVVLVQPTWPNERSVQGEFTLLHSQWAKTTDPPRQGFGSWGDDRVEALNAMASALRAATESGAQARGLDTPEGRTLILSLLARYRAWLGYQLAAAHEIHTGPAPDIALRIVGGADDHLKPPWPVAGLSCTERLAVPGDDLLEAPGLAQAVAGPHIQDQSPTV